MISRLKTSFRGFSLTNYEEITYSGVFVCFGVYLLLLFVFPSEPPDDLLRHMKAYAYGYDYRQMFPFSPGLPAFNMYYLFDAFAGMMDSIMGNYAFIGIQALATTLYGFGIWWLLRGCTSRNLRFALLMVSLALVSNRTFLARPSVFESGLFLIALAACDDTETKWWVHFLLGCLMASFYHLFFIYLIPLVIYRRTYLLSMIAGFVGWFVYAGADYFQTIVRVFTIQGQRVGITISETAPIWPSLLAYIVFLLPVFYFWRKDIKRLFVTGWYLLPNMVRYTEVVSPILISYAKYWDIKISQSVLICIFISCSCIRTPTPVNESMAMFKNVIPAGSKVLCLGYDSMFKLAYIGENLRLSPCMDVGWDANELKAAYKVASKEGTFDITPFKPGQYDYVIEGNLKSVPKGMELYKVAGRWRVWKVSPVGYNK